jgi:hypothetical protein
MSVSMQGTWTILAKTKNAAFAQRFLIQGSSNGKDGIHSVPSVPSVPITVTGTQWSITIQNDKGTGTWVTSNERIGTPINNGSQISFDIKSDDSGGGDTDYDDLILNCSFTPSDSEFVIYGNVKSYSGLCRFNPCFPFPYLVIDTPLMLEQLLVNEKFRSVIQALYPERLRLFEKKVKPRFRKPIPEPDPEPFRPMMIPLSDSETGSVLAAQQLRSSTLTAQASDVQNMQLAAKITVGSSVLSKYSDSIIELAKAKDLLRPICITKARPGLLLRFQEYDRTAAELVGSPYTGEGERQTLGLTVTDELGNYIFRFSQTFADLADEVSDIPSGISTSTGLRPDIIAQIVASIGATPTVLYETALFSDVPNLKRIDLCIPADVLQQGTDNCLGTRAIQAIGNIFTIPGVGNTLDADGRITATHASGPKITRGAWGGSLHMFACFLGKPEVKTYTIRYRKPGGDWSFVQEAYVHINKSAIGNPNSPLHKVGPFDVSLNVDGTERIVPAYNNIEADSNWIETHRLRKIILHSNIYTAALYAGEGNGSVEFKIEGYNAAGNEVAGAQDTIRLYIDNRSMTGDIASITKGGGTPPGECALFQLATPNEALTVCFKVNHPGGFLASWDFKVYYGSATPATVIDSTVPVEPLNVSYNEATHGNNFYGTANGVAPDGDGYITVDLQPTSGAWLPTGKTFCAFSFEVNGYPRITDGYSNFTGGRLDFELIGISL